MALYDNKYWLLSHIRNSFISTDDSGTCELVMKGEHLPEHIVNELNSYPDSDESEDDDLGQEDYDIPLDLEMNRSRVNTHLLKPPTGKRTRIKTVKWENPTELSEEQKRELFVKTEAPMEDKPRKKVNLKELLLTGKGPYNNYMKYGQFDGTGQVSVPVKKYKIFMTFLPDNLKNYPLIIQCLGHARIQELIGLALLKCSASGNYGNYNFKSVQYYGLYITEEDGEVDHDFPCLDPAEYISKFGFTVLGMVEHKEPNNLELEIKSYCSFLDLTQTNSSQMTTHEEIADEAKNEADVKIVGVHLKTMEAPLYQSFRIHMYNKIRTKIEVNLGISCERVEVDPVGRASSSVLSSFSKLKPISYPIATIAACEIGETRGAKTGFKIVCAAEKQDGSGGLKTVYKIHEFEGDSKAVSEIVNKITLVLNMCSSVVQKEYSAMIENKNKN